MRRSGTSRSRRSHARRSSFLLDSWSLEAQGPPPTRLLFRPMPSGKRARQQRQAAVAAPPPVRSTGGAGARQASPKVLGIAGGVIILVIVAIVLGVLLTRHSGPAVSDGTGDGPNIKIAKGTPTVGSSTSQNVLNAAAVATLLKGIPQKDFAFGKPTAPV